MLYIATNPNIPYFNLMTQCKITILGCGGSGGVPLASNFWGDCDPSNPKNRRTRASIWIRTARTSIVIDAGPDFHAQTINYNIDHIDAIIYTHAHADHTNGIDDVRYLAIKQRILGDKEYQFPIYADQSSMNEMVERFPYIFKESKDGLYRPILEKNIISESLEPLTIGDIKLEPFWQIHGSGRSLGFKIGDIVYSTDVSDFDMKVLQSLKGIKTWIVDCGQFGSKTEDLTVHPNIERVMGWNNIVGAERLYLTHLTPRDDYDTVNVNTSDNIEAAYDGLSIKTEI
jgi:phosphoribosyl 1,2-cyclic phosphate phosphodiesterase